MSKRSKNFKARRSCLTILVCIALFCLGSVLTVAATVQSILAQYSEELPDVSNLAYYEPSLTTKIFSSDGQLIGTLFKENRTWTKLEDVSPHLVHAVLSIEDSRFYEHQGVDLIGVMRAVKQTLEENDTQGASTITMQLTRALFLNPKQTVDRKLKEVLLAIRIEKNYTKDEILELYLNQIYLGSGCYGVHAASSLYFDKKPKDLTPAEASLIAGLPQAPSKYSPIYNPSEALERQKLVLGRMLELGYLNQKEHDEAVQDVSGFKFKNKKRGAEFAVLKVPYFTAFVIKQLYKQFDEDLLYRGGLQVYTTVDLKLQKKAEKVVKEMVAKDSKILNVQTGAAVTIENGTGYIRAMVGGTKWDDKNQFNRAWQAFRQPGSSFKTFVYATAIESGYPPSTIVPDAPLTIGKWSPKNSDHRFMGSIPMTTALQYSRNVVAVRLMQLTGIQRVIDVAHSMGIESELSPFYSLALGAADLSPLEMADAISTFPNQGIRIPATPVKIIYDKDGNVVIDNRYPKKKEVLSEATASWMMKMMRNVVRAGTGTRAYLEKHEAAGKTGTTDSFRDAWFVGYTRHYTTAAWVGNDDFSKMWRSYGGDLPAGIWKEIMVFAHRNIKESKLPITKPKKVGAFICADSKMRVGPKCPHAKRKLWPRNQIPKRFCTLHGRPKVVPTSQAVKPTQKTEHKAAPPPPPPKPANFDNPAEIPVPTQIELPTEVPMLPEGAAVEPPPPFEPIEAPPLEAIPVPEPAPVELPPEPEPVPLPVEVVAPPPVEVPLQATPVPAPVE